MTTESHKTPDLTEAQLANIGHMHVNDLVESIPETSPVLATLGLEFCCDDQHSIEEGLELRGIEPEPVIRKLASIASPWLRESRFRSQ